MRPLDVRPTLLGGLVAMAMASAASAGDKLSVIPITRADQTVLAPATLGVLVNKNDAASVELGRRYAHVRGVPAENIIALDLPLTNDAAKDGMKRAVADLRATKIYAHLKGLALAFLRPFRVAGNQSITSAVSDGVSDMVWRGNCNLTAVNPDYGAEPGAVLSAKPAMMLVGGFSYDDSAKLLARGAAADNTDPPGQVYLLTTSDSIRSDPRKIAMLNAASSLGAEIGITQEDNNNLTNRQDVFGFQTGLAKLTGLNTLGFRPGAYADHLTSFGGALFGAHGQTPITELMRAGATGSYGTVREPCNLPAKFPAPDKVLANYLHGDSLLEAYWKSVALTTEGVFVGEPLARPFPLMAAEAEGRAVTLKANRHTRSMLTTFHSPFADLGRFDIVLGASVSVFEVESGVPVLLGKVVIPATFKDGDTLGRVTLRSPNAAQKPILGVMKLSDVGG